MIYEFQNESGEIIERKFKVGKCPSKIKKNGIIYNRIFSIPFIIMDPDKPKTIGGLIDHKKRKDDKEGKLVKKEEKVPWWRKGKKKVDYGLAKMSPKQKEKYIMTGEKS